MLPRIPLLLAILLLEAGCASSPREPFTAASAPEDFAIDLTVRPGSDFLPRPPVHLRPGRFVLFPDGSLHYDRSGDPGKLPEQVRTLDRIEVDELWSQLGEMGFRSEIRGQPPVNFELVEPPADGIAYLIGIAAGGQRRAFLVSDEAADPRVPSAVALVRTLARYAWARDEPETVVRVRPRRYDFGPDPYERYRQPEQEARPELQDESEPLEIGDEGDRTEGQ